MKKGSFTYNTQAHIHILSLSLSQVGGGIKRLERKERKTNKSSDRLSQKNIPYIYRHRKITFYKLSFEIQYLEL